MADNSGIKLFEHNETAYISAVQMLKETGKAAVIHPTGTGKSFIAFKLCEDNADKKICWLSPGEYIFKTQCENLTVTGSAVPNNIAFFTYAKLMLMSDTELERTFSASWSFMYGEAEKYYSENRNLLPPQTYVTEDGYKLGSWISSQRSSYKKHTLSVEKIRLLEKLNFVWNPLDELWEVGFLHAVRYSEVGDINAVKQTYCTPDGYKLGEWLRGQKRQYPKGKLDAERLQRLENICVYFQ